MLSLPPATKMFQFTGFACSDLFIQSVVSGLPHSDISGSLLASSSPELFVGRHVLLRFCVPRYPPLALCSLTTFGLFLCLILFDLISLFFNSYIASPGQISVFYYFYLTFCFFSLYFYAVFKVLSGLFQAQHLGIFFIPQC